MKTLYTVLRWLGHAISPALSVALVFTLAALAVANAQTAPPATPPAPWADPSFEVLPVVYRSVFADTPTGVETQSADWKKANAEVGQFKRGHVDILKWEEAQTQKQMPVQKPLPTPMSPQMPDAAKPAAPSMHKH